MRKLNILILLMILAGLFACSEDFLEQTPTSSQALSDIKTLDDAELLIIGVYNCLQSPDYYNGAFILENDVRADDMACINGNRLTDTFVFDYDPESVESGLWTLPYYAIRQTCQCIDVVSKIETDNEADQARKSDLIGQAKALRALFHFDLARIFAKQYALADVNDLGIPIIDHVLDPFEKLSRNTIGETYTFIVDELVAAIPMLYTEQTEGYLNAYGAKAILARVYLYMEENTKAYSLATDVIENGPYELIDREEYVNSWSETYTTESLLSVINSTDDNGGGESVGNISDRDSYGSFGASQDFINLMSLDQDDIRFQLLYVDKEDHPLGRVLKYPGLGNTKDVVVDHVENGADLKAEALTSAVPVIRLSEVYLIAAEAAVKESDNANAIKYLNPIVERGNPNNTVAEADVSLDRVLLERRKELVAEGHRFFDLIRNSRDVVRIDDARMHDKTAAGTFEYTNFYMVFPIPQEERNVNELVKQNDGY